ncbi:MAG: transposase [Myxococcales bacterium]|nr:transposase [Myxococcales bacterium]
MARRAQRGSERPRGVGKASRFGFEPALVLRAYQDELFDGLGAWCRDAARDVLSEMWVADVEGLCGERWRPRPRSRVARAGWCRTEIMLGGERIPVRRPRVRSAQGREVELRSFRASADTDFLGRSVIEDVCAAVATGRFPEERYLRSPIQAAFVDQLVARLGALHATPKGEFDPGLLIHELTFPDLSFLGALGIDARGQRRLVGLASGRLDDPARVEALLTGVVGRHRRSAPPAVCLVGESPVVHSVLRTIFGSSVIIQRCPSEKRRRTLDRLPPSLQPAVLEDLLAAYASPNAQLARRALDRVARSLAPDHPEAAAALRDGLDETLALPKLAGTKSPRSRSAGARRSAART